MKSLIRYFLVAAVILGGGLCLLLNVAANSAAEVFSKAVQCSNATSQNCYQLSAGVITASSVATVLNSSRQEDDVSIGTGGKTVRVFLQVSDADAALLRVGVNVIVKWWVGTPVSVAVTGRELPTTGNPAADHSVFAYVGWSMLGIAAAALGVPLMNRILRR